MDLIRHRDETKGFLKGLDDEKEDIEKRLKTIDSMRNQVIGRLQLIEEILLEDQQKMPDDLVGAEADSNGS